jgi:hypothetical protein
MNPTARPVEVRRRGRKRATAARTATFSITITTSGRGGAGWFHEVHATSPAELRTIMAREVEALVGSVWGLELRV